MEADHHDAADALGGERHPAALTRPAGHHRLDRCLDTVARQSGHQLLALPRAIGIALPVLQRAPAATAEMDAGRLDALRGGNDDLDDPSALAATLDDEFLARQRERHVERPRGGLGDAVAAMADAIDEHGLGHRGSRLGGLTRRATGTTAASRARGVGARGTLALSALALRTLTLGTRGVHRRPPSGQPRSLADRRAFIGRTFLRRCRAHRPGRGRRQSAKLKTGRLPAGRNCPGGAHAIEDERRMCA